MAVAFVLLPPHDEKTIQINRLIDLSFVSAIC